ncbi:MAG: hypothetical protein JO091_14870, partial [Acidobacteriaceae bacterium]|nr:hypothetical protein [Acidobacteriaceae bacterium]
MEALAEYTVRRDRWRAERQILERQFNRIGNWRLTLGIAEVALACLVFGPHWLTPWILAIPAVAFIVLVVVHQRILRRRTRAGRAMAHYERGLARLEDRWPGNGNQGERFRDTGHVYADDLDVFGKGSLFELLATTRTAAGDKKLADWLLRPASRDEALARQAAVRELSTCLELHQDLALLGDDVRAEVHIDAIDTWASSGAVPFSAPLRALLPLLAVTGVVAL